MRRGSSHNNGSWWASCRRCPILFLFLTLLTRQALVCDVTVVVQEESQTIRVEIPTAADHYYVIFKGTSVSSLQTPVALFHENKDFATFSEAIAQAPTSAVFYRIQPTPITAPADVDGDGIDDLYEHQSPILNPLDSADAHLDSDQDGKTNLTEYLQGSDPELHDGYSITALSDSLLIGREGDTETLIAQVTDQGVPVSGISLSLELKSPIGTTRTQTLTTDHNGTIAQTLPFEPGTTQARLFGIAVAETLEFYFSTVRLIPLTAAQSEAFAGQPVVLSVQANGAPIVPAEFQISVRDSSSLQTHFATMDASGKLSFPTIAGPGSTHIEFQSPAFPGQMVAFEINGLEQKAGVLQFATVPSAVPMWLNYGESIDIEVLAQDPEGIPLAGVPIAPSVTMGDADIQSAAGHTGLDGSLTWTLTPRQTGLLTLAAQSDDLSAVTRFPVQPLTYETDLKPILQKCTDCHHPDHSLPLGNYEQVRFGVGPRSRQPIVQPDRPDESPIVYLTRPDGEMFLNTQCCLTTPPLTLAESDRIREWVAGGGLETFELPGQPVRMVPIYQPDAVGVPGTRFPSELGFRFLDAAVRPVPLVPLAFTSSEPSDTLVAEHPYSSIHGEVRLNLNLGPATRARQIQATAETFPLSGSIHLPINPNYHGGSLADSSHAFDQAVISVLKPANLEPTAPADRAEFLIRVVEDTTGRHPDPDDPELGEAIAHYTLQRDTPESRNRLIDALVDSEAFLNHWVADRIASWLEMPSVGDARMGHPRFDVPVIQTLQADASLAELLKAIGGLGGSESDWDRHQPFEAGTAIASIHDFMDGGKNSFDLIMESFAGTSIGCARCHDHKLTGANDDPRWTQEEAYGMYAFFATGSAALNMPQADGSEILNSIQYPRWILDGAAQQAPSTNPITDFGLHHIDSVVARRNEFWNRLTESPVFTRTVAHRIWSEIATPLLDPGDIRNETLEPLRASGMVRLFDALQAEFERVDTNLREFMRSCLRSQLYQLSSHASPEYSFQADAFLGRFPVRRRFAEVLNHGLYVAGGMPFEHHDPHQLQALGYPIRSFALFWSDRRHSAGVTEALVLLNSPQSVGERATQKDSLIQQQSLLKLRQAAPADRAQVFSDLAHRMVQAAFLRAPTPTEAEAIAALPSTEESLLDLAAALGVTAEFVFR